MTSPKAEIEEEVPEEAQITGVDLELGEAGKTVGFKAADELTVDDDITLESSRKPDDVVSQVASKVESAIAPVDEVLS